MAIQLTIGILIGNNKCKILSGAFKILVDDAIFKYAHSFQFRILKREVGGF